MKTSYTDALALLIKHDQDHVLKFWNILNKDQQKGLLSQIANLDFKNIKDMQALLHSSKNANKEDATEIQPANVFQLSQREKNKVFRLGEDILRSGKVGVLLVAGGQGSRLGFDGPKGAFSLAPVSGASLFEIHARKIMALERKYCSKKESTNISSGIPFYIMTSMANDLPTKSFFNEHDFFGLSKDRVKFFTQGMFPALREDGRLVMDKPDHIFMNPDGHGGILTALKKNRMFEDMKERGIETLFYFQVDNPLVDIADPAFIGLHTKHRADISVKVCAKRNPEEGLGVAVERNGKNTIVEYTELTHEQKHEKRKDGNLNFRFGSVAIHIFSLNFLKKEANDKLPLHIAHKKVSCCNETGEIVKPDKPNVYKFEKFIFDVLPDSKKSVILEFNRSYEFSPVKNAKGDDSPETAKNDITLKYARWLEDCGINIAKDDSGAPVHKIEIDPCFAISPEDLKEKLNKNFKVDRDIFLT